MCRVSSTTRKNPSRKKWLTLSIFVLFDANTYFTLVPLVVAIVVVVVVKPVCISYYLWRFVCLSLFRFFCSFPKSSLHLAACGAAILCQTLLVFAWFVSPFRGFTTTYSSWNEYILTVHRLFLFATHLYYWWWLFSGVDIR